MLYAQLAALIRHQRSPVVACDVHALADPDAGTIEVLARLQLAARRLGGRLRLRRADQRLRELIGLCGLAAVLPTDGGSVVQGRRKAEQREQVRGVQE